MSHRSSDSNQIIGLDWLRFIAASMVMMFHLSYWGWKSPEGTTGIALAGAAEFPHLGPWFSSGWVGVNIFFVLSGFVIAYTADTKSAYEFLSSRVKRLYPAAWLCASITLCFALIADLYPDSAAALKDYASSISLFPFGPWIDGVYWSLRVEISFYAFVFVLLLFNAFRYLEQIITLVGCASGLFCVAVKVLFRSHGDLIYTDVGQLSLLSYGTCFALGVTFWLGAKSGFNLRRIVLCVLYAFGAVLVVAPPAGSLPAIAIFCLSVFWIFASIRYNAIAMRFVGSSGVRLLRALGLATYPIYLIHNVVGAVTIRWLVHAGVPQIFALFISIAAIILCAFCIVRYLEPPLRRVAGLLLSTSFSLTGATVQKCLTRPTVSAMPT